MGNFSGIYLSGMERLLACSLSREAESDYRTFSELKAKYLRA
jgi:hypothetical protein